MLEQERTRGAGPIPGDSGYADSASAPAPKVEVRRSARRRRTVTAYRERDTIVVLIPGRMSRAEEKRFVDDMVRRVLDRESRTAPPAGDAALLDRADALAGRFLDPGSPRPRRVSWVRNQQQRWGSCTPSTATIRLSSRLQVMPDWVVDYVLLHEVAHLAEPTHSSSFWALVDRYPQAERARGYLEGYLAGQSRAGSDVAGSGGEGAGA